MRVLEIGEGGYVAIYAPGITDFYSIHKTAPEEKRLTRSRVLMLSKRLKAGYYDLVVYSPGVKTLAPWHRQGSALKNFGDSISWSLGSFHRIAWHYFHYFLCQTDTPLIIIDTQDAPRLSKTESFWLDRCQFLFMRELPPNHKNLFLNMDRRCGDVVNIQRQERLVRNFGKIRPFSLGFDSHGMEKAVKVEASDKIHDVFFSGTTKWSTVRERGFEEILALRAAGLRVFIPEQRLSQEDFFRACAQSWLVWSPEGLGWDCHRHYESLMHYSVPLINQPTIERYQPFLNGEHCLYYPPEPGGLIEAIKSALQDREKLLKIAEQGRAHVLAYHRRCDLVRHIFSCMEVLEQAEPHIVDA